MSQVITSQNGICRYCDSITKNQADEFCCLACRTLFESGWSKTSKPSDDLDSLAFSETSHLYNISSSSEKTSYRLSIQGLHCSSCVHLLEDLPKYLTEVASARVNFPRSELYIDVCSDHSLGKIVNFIKEMGYPARPLAPDEDKTAEQIAEDRDLLCRLGVAGACTGNIMLFTVAIYGGLQGNLGFWFNGISFLLFLPIVFYSAVPIYRGAWAALRLKSVNADFSLALALWVGFCASVVNWYRGSGAIYFDSSAGFIFLILISRWFLRTSQRRWANGSISFDHWNRGSFKVQRSGQTKYLPASQLSPEDIVYLRRGIVVPVDSQLESTSALFDTSWMTGESVPRIIQCESNITAGYRLLSEDCALRVVTSSQDSELMRGLRRIEVEALSQSHRIGTFDRAARILLSSVFIIGLLTVLFGPLLEAALWNKAKILGMAPTVARRESR